MADTKKVRALRMNSLRSDGTTNTDDVILVVRDPLTGEPMLHDDGTPAVTITLRPLRDGEHDEIVRRHTTPEKSPTGRGFYEKVDSQAISDEILEQTIVSWAGLVGVDDRPLVCTARTKRLLPERVKIQVTRKLFDGEATEVAAESFR